MSVYTIPNRATPLGRPVTAERTFVPLKASSVEPNGEFSGYGAIFGNLDDGGDIIEPGFFAPVVNDFLTEGSITWNHDWSRPVAIPLEAREDQTGLFIRASFHGHADGQYSRTVTSERLERGKQVGLSIGYEIAPGGATFEGGARHLRTASRLFEVSLVMAPMNRLAGVTAVKMNDRPTAQPATAPVFAFIDVPAGWVGVPAKVVAARAVALASWSLRNDRLVDTIHYFADADSALAAESKAIGFGRPYDIERKAGYLGGYGGYFAHASPGHIWLKASLPLVDVARLAMHETAHAAGFGESDAREFADVLLPRSSQLIFG